MKENIKGMLHYTRQAFGVSLVLMLLCGLLFPLLLSGISAILFPHQAEGSLIEIELKLIRTERNFPELVPALITMRRLILSL